MKISKYLPYLMWVLPLSFFGYQFILRLWPSLVMNQIMTQYMVDATVFGILASAYYYGYSAMQIPVAIMLDKFGVRVILFICAVTCGIAMLVMTYSESWIAAITARLMIGAGSAVGFLGVSKVISEWFDKALYTRMVGFSFSVGLLGAVYGGRPVSSLIDSYNWVNVATVIAGISIFIGLMILLFVKNNKNVKNSSDEQNVKITDLKKIIISKEIWMLAVANLLMVGALEGFADVWGVNYLIQSFSISKTDAAGLVSFIFIGMIFGGPFLAFMSERIGNYFTIIFAGIGMVMIFILIQFFITYNWILIAMLFFTLGVLCCYQVIVFAQGSEMVDGKLLGITIAFLNSINMLGGSFFHSFIGVLMDHFWLGQYKENGIKLYDVTTYNKALLIIPISAFIGSMIILLLKKKQSSAKLAMLT